MKTARLTLRIEPKDKELLEQMARGDCRSLADEITWLIRREFEARERAYNEEQAALEGYEVTDI